MILFIASNEIYRISVSTDAKRNDNIISYGGLRVQRLEKFNGTVTVSNAWLAPNESYFIYDNPSDHTTP